MRSSGSSIAKAGSTSGSPPGTCNRGAGRLRLTRLAARAVPGPAAAGASLLDRRAAAVARLVGAAVHLELVLHRPALAVWEAVVAQRRALAREARRERRADRGVQPPELGGRELARGPQRMDARAPERLVDVDVPHSGEGALVEQRGLDRRAPAGETLSQSCGREAVGQLLAAAARVS